MNKENFVILQNNESIGLMNNCIEIINDILKKISYTSIDLLIDELHIIYDNLLKIIGDKEDIEFINKMFNKFCLGK